MLVGAVSSVNCDFESAFKCGYTSSEMGSLAWSRTNSESLFKTLTGPNEDVDKSTTGTSSPPHTHNAVVSTAHAPVVSLSAVSLSVSPSVCSYHKNGAVFKH